MNVLRSRLTAINWYVISSTRWYHCRWHICLVKWASAQNSLKLASPSPYWWEWEGRRSQKRLRLSLCAQFVTGIDKTSGDVWISPIVRYIQTVTWTTNDNGVEKSHDDYHVLQMTSTKRLEKYLILEIYIAMLSCCRRSSTAERRKRALHLYASEGFTIANNAVWYLGMGGGGLEGRVQSTYKNVYRNTLLLVRKNDFWKFLKIFCNEIPLPFSQKNYLIRFSSVYAQRFVLHDFVYSNFHFEEFHQFFRNKMAYSLARLL